MSIAPMVTPNYLGETYVNVRQLVAESNRIEGITREPTKSEIDEFERFLGLEKVTIDELRAFVKVYQPNAVLRDASGLNVRVGNHFPPRGGPEIPLLLGAILHDAQNDVPAWDIHCRYETLHPFTDGNGRSGRMLWYWQMANSGHWPHAMGLGFLHAFYYQCLQNIGKSPA